MQGALALREPFEARLAEVELGREVSVPAARRQGSRTRTCPRLWLPEKAEESSSKALALLSRVPVERI